MTATVAPARPQTGTDRSTFVALAARELRRFIVNPVFLFAVLITTWIMWSGPGTPVTEIDTVNGYPAILLGGFGMMATFWLTRSMRYSEPVVGVTPTSQPARSAALCTVAVVPLACGVLTLFAFVHVWPIGAGLYGALRPQAQVAVLVSQIVVPSLGGPLLGVALGRWVRFPGAAFLVFLAIYGWVSLVTILSFSHTNSTVVTALRLLAPFSFFTYTGDAGDGMTSWRGSPWFFIGWQLALCAIAVLVAMLRGADGRVRARITRTLAIVLVLAVVMLVLAVVGGFSHAVHA